MGVLCPVGDVKIVSSISTFVLNTLTHKVLFYFLLPDAISKPRFSQCRDCRFNHLWTYMLIQTLNQSCFSLLMPSICHWCEERKPLLYLYQQFLWNRKECNQDTEMLTRHSQDSPGFWIPRRGFRIRGTGFQYLSVELGFWIPIVSGIPDSLSCIPDSKTQNSGFHKPNFFSYPYKHIRYTYVTSDEWLKLLLVSLCLGLMIKVNPYNPFWVLLPFLWVCRQKGHLSWGLITFDCQPLEWVRFGTIADLDCHLH